MSIFCRPLGHLHLRHSTRGDKAISPNDYIRCRESSFLAFVALEHLALIFCCWLHIINQCFSNLNLFASSPIFFKIWCTVGRGGGLRTSHGILPQKGPVKSENLFCLIILYNRFFPMKHPFSENNKCLLFFRAKEFCTQKSTNSTWS